MGKLDGKVAFITGAARGQGRSHAARLAEEGADIVAIDVCRQFDTCTYAGATTEDLTETVELVEALDRRILARHADVRDRAALDEIVKEAVAELGHIDIVLANAGIMPFIGEPGASAQAWYDSIDVMLTGVYLTIEACLPPMLARDAGGSIVITSSLAGLKGAARAPHNINAGFAGYTAAKHGVVGLMHLYANGLACRSIRVNTVHPTSVNTPMVANDEFPRWIADNPEMVPAVQNALPVELIEAIDISNAIVYLCSEDGRYVTNVSLPVDAGISQR